MMVPEGKSDAESESATESYLKTFHHEDFGQKRFLQALRTLQIIRTPGSKLECSTSKNYSPDIELEVSGGKGRYYGPRLGATALER